MGAALTGHFLLGAQAATTTQTFAAVADSWVNQESPNTNYGTATNLRIDNSPVRKSYLRFDVRSLAGAVTKATLRLYPTTTSSTGYSVRRVADSSWGEKTLTYNNAPAPSTNVTASSGRIASRQWTSLDVTSLVSANGLASFALTTTSATSMSVASREYGASFAPQLVVTTTSVPPSNTSPPTVSGAPEDGRTLTGDPGTWAGTEPISYSYRWQRCDAAGGSCEDIPDATGKAYTLRSGDVGHTMRTAVTASNAAGSATQSSGATGVVKAIPPASESPPSVSGAAYDGSTLTADAGAWSGTEPIAYSYQWRRCDAAGASCEDITDATAKTYTPTSADVGSTILVAVTATNLVGSSVAASGRTTAVAPAPVLPANTSPPTISGTTQDGGTLTADPGTWLGTEPISYSYQWRRCDAAGASCEDIADATAKTYTPTSVDAGSTVRVGVTASNLAGSTSETSEASSPIEAADPVIAAAGDIACDPGSTAFNGGLGTTSSCHQMATSNLLTGGKPAAVLPLGDVQYEDGALAKFQQSYDPSWGRVKGITRPVPGNHEYQTAGAPGYFDYFNGTGNANGSAGDRSTGYYSFNVGAWHLVALNSNCSKVGGCGAGSPQEQWLRRDLAANTADCTLAYWHHPLFSSGTYSPGVSSVKPLFQALFDYRADVVLAGHDHNYERFAPQDPSGTLDLARGLRQFVVGTGGKSHYGQGTPVPNSEVRNSDSFGILELTLHARSYDWRFVPEAGKTFADSGSDSCNGAEPDGEPPSPPGNLTASAQSSSLVELSWGAATDNVGVTGYEIYRNGTQLTTTTSAVTGYSDGSVSPSSTYQYQVRARDAAGNVSVLSTTATVTTPSITTALSFSPEADARVQEASPSTNYGTSYLRADGGNDPDVESYLRFGVTGVAGAVQGAKLRIYAYTDTIDGPRLYSASNAWTEGAISWSTRPVRAGIATDDRGTIPANTWVEYNVTPLVLGDATYTFVLSTGSSDGVDMYSREAASLRPELVVTFTR